MLRTDFTRRIAIVLACICAVVLAARPPAGVAQDEPGVREATPSGSIPIHVSPEVLADPTVASFVSWMEELPLGGAVLRVDDPILLGQLMIVRLQRLQSPDQEIDDARKLFVTWDVPATSLEMEEARRSVKEWFHRAAEGEDATGSRYRLIAKIAEGGFGISLRRPALTEAELECAQLNILQRITHGASEAETRAAISRYITDGFPQDAFAEDVLMECAVRVTARKILANPAMVGWEVTRARAVYGIDPEALYAHLPAPAGDIGNEVARYLAEIGRAEGTPPTVSILDLRNRILRPQDVRAIIATTEKANSKAAFHLCLTLLRSDWSQIGSEYLYGKLSSLTDVNDLRAVLGALDARGDFSASDLERLLARVKDQGIVDSVFRFAGTSLSHASTRAAAGRFLLEQLNASDAEHRAQAIKALVLQPGVGDRVLLQAGLDAMQREGERDARLRVIELVGYSRSSEIVDVMLDWMKNDASADVRRAVVQSVSLNRTVSQTAPHESRVAAALRDLAASDGSEVVRAAAQRRLADLSNDIDSYKAEWAARLARHAFNGQHVTALENELSPVEKDIGRYVHGETGNNTRYYLLADRVVVGVDLNIADVIIGEPYVAHVKDWPGASDGYITHPPEFVP